MDGTPALITLTAAAPVPDGVMVDGAVAELTRHGDGSIVAEIRIPGRQQDNG